MDNNGLGEILSHQASANLNVRQADPLDHEKQRARKKEDAEDSARIPENQRVQRQEELQNANEATSERFELERNQVPQNDESPPDQGEDGSSFNGGENRLDITA